MVYRPSCLRLQALKKIVARHAVLRGGRQIKMIVQALQCLPTASLQHK
jgi:hypothetical protein